jgi:hypothetical protein
VGSRNLKFDVADDAKIDVKVADYTSFARRGDKITVKGKMNPSATGVAIGAKVNIEAAAPFSSGKAKPAAKTPPRSSKKN